MTTAMAFPGNTAQAFLIHIFGRSLEGDHYVVERFRAMADGDIRIDGNGPVTATKGRRKASPVAAIDQSPMASLTAWT